MVVQQYITYMCSMCRCWGEGYDTLLSARCRDGGYRSCGQHERTQRIIHSMVELVELEEQEEQELWPAFRYPIG